MTDQELGAWFVQASRDLIETTPTWLVLPPSLVARTQAIVGALNDAGYPYRVEPAPNTEMFEPIRHAWGDAWAALRLCEEENFFN